MIKLDERIRISQGTNPKKHNRQKKTRVPGSTAPVLHLCYGMSHEPQMWERCWGLHQEQASGQHPKEILQKGPTHFLISPHN